MTNNLKNNFDNRIINIPGVNDYYFGECFVPLIWNGMIVNRYIISNYGRLYDYHTSSFVNYSTDKDGYYMASIKIEGVGFKKIRVHRFVLMSFCFIPDYEKKQANHKDGNKQHNFILNLEWTTPMANTRHGWDTGLNNNVGVFNGNGKYNEEFIRKICSYIDQGLSNPDICNNFNITDKEDRMRMSATITGIRKGKTHRYISKDYNFMSNDVYMRHSEEFARIICLILSDGNSHTYKEIMDRLMIPNNQRKYFRIYIDDIIRKRTAKTVSDKFPPLITPAGRNEDDYMIS